MVGQRYRIVSRIGAGGMGVVFEAVNVATEGHVALKWLNPELSTNARAVERFKTEARATGRIQHPNVVAIHDIGEGEGTLFLVMELLKGESLRTRLNRGPLDLTEACKILLPVMRGVSAAHKVGVLHRDIKPENIFLCEMPDGLEAVPKILDFGIAKLSSDSENAQRTSLQTGFLGTYPFMAFEQLHARGDLDVRVDVYALGAVLYNMVTGKLPYEADNAVDLALRMMQGDRLPATQHVPTLPAALDVVLERALAREREQRYPNIESLASALEQFADSMRFRGSNRPAPASVIPPPARPPQPEVVDELVETVAAIPTPYRPSLERAQAPRAKGEGPDTLKNESQRAPRAMTSKPDPTRKGTSTFAIAGALVAVLIGGGVAVKFGLSDGASESAAEAPAGDQAEPSQRAAAAPKPPPLPVQPAQALTPQAAPAPASADDWEEAPTPAPAPVAAPVEPAPVVPAQPQVAASAEPEVKAARKSKDEIAFEAGLRDQKAGRVEEAHGHFSKMSASSALRQRPEVKKVEQAYAALQKSRAASTSKPAASSVGASRPATTQGAPTPAPTQDPSGKSFRAGKPSLDDFIK